MDNGKVAAGEKRRSEGGSPCLILPLNHSPTALAELRVREVWVGFPPLSGSSLPDPEPQFPLLETGDPDAHILWWLGGIREL